MAVRQLDPELERQAEALGLPVDSLRRFESAGYSPHPRQLEFHAKARACDQDNGPVDIAIGGARGGGKTRAVISQIAIDDCPRVAGLKALFLRKVGKAARESFEDLRRQTLTGVRHTYKESRGIVEFPNGSRIVLGHFNAEKDIDQYLGIEYDVIAVEEATQLTEQKRKDIATCLRTSKPDFRPRCYHTTNPGGVSHAQFKKQFIEPWRKGEETTTRFIPATVDDNPSVNKDYRSKLEALTGWKRAAWLEGNWDIAAGQFFTTWRHSLHVCEPFPIPFWWPVWASLDYGFTHPTVAYLLTEHDGTIYVVAEHYAAKQLVPQHVAEIETLFGKWGVSIDRLDQFLAGADVFAKRGDSSGKSIAQQYEDLGITLTSASMDRIARASTLLRRLGDHEHGIRPTLKVFSNCVNLIECVPTLQHDPHRPEDVLKTDVDEDGTGGDDPYDAVGMGLLAKEGLYEVDSMTRRAFAFR